MDNSVGATVEEESKDWINELPDCILSYILSFLTIKDAAETSIVCRRWKNLWKTRSSNLVLDIVNIFGSRYAPLSEQYDRRAFAWFSSRELERRCYIKRVKKVLELLSCHKLDLFKVAFFLDRKYTYLLDKWVCFAVTMGAQKLDLRLYGYRHFYVFPHWILADLNVSTLKHLSLHQCVLKPPSDFDRFVQLTTLYLNVVQVDPNFLAHLFSDCSLLESLTLIRCGVSSNLNIGPSLHLHDLKVLSCYGLTRLEIDAVNLSSLEHCGSRNEIILMRTPKLVSFFFNQGYECPLPLTQLTFCPELSALHLQIREDIQLIPQNFPTLKNLKQVKLGLIMHDFELGSVLHILRAAPLLEELVMTVHVAHYHGDMKNLSTFSHDHLRRIKMEGFQGMWSEIEFAICILKIATKLELMVVDPLGSWITGVGMRYNIACSYQNGNEYEHRPEVPEGYTSDEDENMEDSERCLLCWQKRGRAAVQEKLKQVKTDAQVIIL